MSQSDDDEEEEYCPLCCETLDITDRNFFPCPCEYQVWRKGGREGGRGVVWSRCWCNLLLLRQSYQPQQRTRTCLGMRV
jgi:hypothetical protein